MGDRWRVHAGWLRGVTPINPFAPTVYIPFAVWMVLGVYFNYRYNLRLPRDKLQRLRRFGGVGLPLSLLSLFNICLHPFDRAIVELKFFSLSFNICLHLLTF